MTLRHLNIFITVYEERNMTNAAKKLYMTQPSVSQAIKELEEYYEEVLFDRFPRTLYPTEAGNEVYQHASQIMSVFDKSKDRVHKKEKIKIGANITVGATMIQQYVKSFEQLYPDVKVLVSINNAGYLLGLLLKNELDMVLIEERELDPHLTYEVFFQDRIVLLANNQHPLTRSKNLHLCDIANEDFLLREQGAGVRITFDKLASLNGFPVQPTWESCSSYALINAVKENIGIAVLPYRIAKEHIDRKEVTELPIQDLNLNRKLQIVYHKDKHFSQPLNYFKEIVATTHFE